jgi:hypothetical protein
MKKIPSAVLAVAFVTVAGPSFAADGVLEREEPNIDVQRRSRYPFRST